MDEDALRLPEGVEDPRLRRLFGYWKERAPPARLPGRQHIDPLDIPDLLPFIVLIDVISAAGQVIFRWRLFGTKIAELFGADYTGRTVDETFTLDQAGIIRESMMWVVANRRAHYWEQRLYIESRKFLGYKRLLLPLAHDGETIDMLLGCGVPIRKLSGG